MAEEKTEKFDKLSVILDGLVAALLLTGRNGGAVRSGPIDGGAGVGGKGFFTSLMALIIRIWEEKGGSMKDESEMLESLFSGPSTETKPLSVEERKKISAVIKSLSPTERKVFRIAIFLMDPETITIDSPEKKNADGKITSPAGKVTQKTGVDPRINVLRGIAEMVDDDHGNAGKVADTLREAGTLGGNNEAIAFYGKIQQVTKKLLCELFEVESVEEITRDIVKREAKRLFKKYIEPEDVTMPRRDDTAGTLLRIARSMTPGSFPNKKPQAINGGTKLLLIAILVTICLALVFLSVKRVVPSKTDIIINAYSPTEQSAHMPMK